MSDIIDQNKIVYSPLKLTPYDRALRIMEINMNREINYIPYSLSNIQKFVPGVEPHSYNIITANSGIGKTQITDFLALNTPISFYEKNFDKIKLKIFYWSLEMSEEMKALQILGNTHFRSTNGLFDPLNADRITIKQMLSYSKDKLSAEKFSIFKNYKSYFDWFYEIVEIKSGYITPMSIYQTFYEFYNNPEIGKMHFKEVPYTAYNYANGSFETKIKTVFDRYELNKENENLFVIGIIDHMALVKDPQLKDKRAIMEITSEYLMTVRNMFNTSIYAINQQASDQEKKENFMRPTLSGLGDNKAIQRDADYIFGLYDPARNNDMSCNGWDVRSLNQTIREFSVLKSRYNISNISTNLLMDGTVENFIQLPDYNLIEQDVIEKWYAFAKQIKTI